MRLVDFVEQIKDREDFRRFLSLLLQDLAENGDKWENSTLESFLGGMGGFVGDMEGFYKNRGEKIDLSRPTWKVLAHALLAATVYE
jgi:hypothetical protein